MFRLVQMTPWIAGAVLFSSTIAFAQGTPPTAGTVVAQVNGQPINYSQLVTRLLDYQGEATLEALVNRAVVQQAADREHIAVTDAEIGQRIAQVKQLLGG